MFRVEAKIALNPDNINLATDVYEPKLTTATKQDDGVYIQRAPMKIAFIIQRYGTEILSGSEHHCRLIAENLSVRHEIEVLTTCAKNNTTWRNEYPEGTDRIRSVTVRRFANSKTRNLETFNTYSNWIFNNPHTEKDEEEWLQQQGPWCPALIEHLEQKHKSYDALIFFTYLYAPSVLGLRVNPKRSILVPNAHDEPSIRLKMYKDVFGLPAAIAFNTKVERGFLRNHFSINAKTQEVVGCGVELPPYLDPKLEIQTRTEETENGSAGSANAMFPLSSAQGVAFRRRHRLYGPFSLYDALIDQGKGCEELIEYFGNYVNNYGNATLALAGIKLMTIPEAPFIRFAGILSPTDRVEALEAATVVIVPSPNESLSLLALEAFAVGTPVLANAQSDVLTDHCQRSNAGLYYGSREEFVECLRLLVHNSELRAIMGKNGQAYVRDNFCWDIILDKYDHMIKAVSGRRRRQASRNTKVRNRGEHLHSRRRSKS